jgi:hypothetical protein
MDYRKRLDRLRDRLADLLSSRRYSRAEFGKLPDSPGVYLFRKKATGKVMYVGRTGRNEKRTIKVRVREHFHHFKDIRKAYSQPAQKWLVETKGLKPRGTKTLSQVAISYLQDNYLVQCVPIIDAGERAAFERFVFAVLKPPANLAKDFEH